MKKYHVFDFEGMTVKVLSQYDESCDMYIDEFPDFEEEPLYTPSGKPLVTAMQDQCEFAASGDEEVDCGSCKFYRPNHPGDLIGICLRDERRQLPEDVLRLPKICADG